METMKLSSSGNRKRKIESEFESSSETDTIFALLMASLSKPNPTPETVSLVTKCLNRLRTLLFEIPSPAQPFHVLSLLPLLLTSRSFEIVCLGAEFVGAALLCSMEMNEQIASDIETVKALISLLVNSKKRASIAACNAVLDLCTTSFGQRRLLELSALETLMSALLQVPPSSISVFLCTGHDAKFPFHKIGFKKNELLALLFDATVILLNTCCSIELERISRELAEGFLQFWKHIWRKIHDQVVLDNVLMSNKARQYHMSNTTINNMAESLFRLSALLLTISPSEIIRSSLFNSKVTTFTHFISTHWEISPTLVGRLSSASLENFFLRSVKYSSEPEDALPLSVSSLLQCLNCCPPIASDEGDILNFLKEVKDKLGCPLFYEQDIRVLRVEKQTEREVHFFCKNFDDIMKTPYLLFFDDIQKCEAAFRDGYTIALRGMEFRFSSIASVACELASLFGQPSVGANLYLTPPNSQGLAAHYDDHCVFVCQIRGSKRWKISNEAIVKLPRLYAPRVALKGECFGVLAAACKNILLTEGDVLYIPRGYAHEACTDDVRSDGSVASSLHLTLSVEVEPPFEWEGFLHLALFYWSRIQKHRHCILDESLYGLSKIVATDLLHLNIKKIGTSDPNFRKTCLVASNWLKTNQKSTFTSLISTIISESKFPEALGMVECAVQNNEDPFGEIRWLQFLDSKMEFSGSYNQEFTFTGIENMIDVCTRHRDVAEAAFMEVKDGFCSEVVFEDCVESYTRLLERYKRVRTEYMNGMLSLHPH